MKKKNNGGQDTTASAQSIEKGMKKESSVTQPKDTTGFELYFGDARA